jgi:glyoxylate/hydroxypyruvate reductase
MVSFCYSNDMKKVLVTRALLPKVLAEFSDAYQLDVWDSTEVAMPRDELLSRSAGAHAIVCMLTDKIDEELVNAVGTQLEVVSTMSVGIDHVDTNILKERNIRLGYTPDVLTDSVADMTIALMLAASRRVPEAISAAREGKWGTWSPYWMSGQDLSRATVGIIGLGAIGAEVARRLSGFHCKVLYTSRTRKESIEQELGIQYVERDQLLQQSDFVSIHSALTPDTAGLCNSKFFAKMKSTAVFVNTSRGGLVDQNALYDALREGRIYSAGLDVTTPEPLPLDNLLFTLKNCVILPHIGSASVRTREAMTQIAVANTIKALNGEKMQYEVAL